MERGVIMERDDASELLPSVLIALSALKMALMKKLTALSLILEIHWTRKRFCLEWRTRTNLEVKRKAIIVSKTISSTMLNKLLNLSINWNKSTLQLRCWINYSVTVLLSQQTKTVSPLLWKMSLKSITKLVTIWTPCFLKNPKSSRRKTLTLSAAPANNNQLTHPRSCSQKIPIDKKKPLSKKHMINSICKIRLIRKYLKRKLALLK